MALTINQGSLKDKQLEPNDSSEYTFVVYNTVGWPNVSIASNGVTVTINANGFKPPASNVPLSGVSVSDVSVTPGSPIPPVASQSWVVTLTITTGNVVPAPPIFGILDISVDYTYEDPTPLTGNQAFAISPD